MSAAVRRADILCKCLPSDRDHRARAAGRGALKGVRPRRPASAREHRRLTQKGVVVDLLHEEIRYIGARD